MMDEYMEQLFAELVVRLRELEKQKDHRYVDLRMELDKHREGQLKLEKRMQNLELKFTQMSQSQTTKEAS